MGTITRKPTGRKGDAPQPSEAEIQAIIHKGLSEPADPTASAEEDTTEAQVKLRVPAALLKRVDAAVKARPIKTPLHQ